MLYEVITDREQLRSVAGGAGGHDLVVPLPVPLAQAGGDDDVERLAEGVDRPVTEEGFGPPVPEADEPLAVAEESYNFV